jgi:hypothetical protein
VQIESIEESLLRRLANETKLVIVAPEAAHSFRQEKISPALWVTLMLTLRAGLYAGMV